MERRLFLGIWDAFKGRVVFDGDRPDIPDGSRVFVIPEHSELGKLVKSYQTSIPLNLKGYHISFNQEFDPETLHKTLVDYIESQKITTKEIEQLLVEISQQNYSKHKLLYLEEGVSKLSGIPKKIKNPFLELYAKLLTIDELASNFLLEIELI